MDRKIAFFFPPPELSEADFRTFKTLLLLNNGSETVFQTAPSSSRMCILIQAEY